MMSAIIYYLANHKRKLVRRHELTFIYKNGYSGDNLTYSFKSADINKIKMHGSNIQQNQHSQLGDLPQP